MKKLQMIQENHVRSIIKSITFRITVIISDLTTSYFITKDFNESITFVIATNISSTILYYLHERLWNKIDWFRNSKDHLLRSIIKSILFRIIVLISDFLITSQITGSVNSTLDIIIFTNLLSTAIYFIHERLWNKISFGRYTI